MVSQRHAWKRFPFNAKPYICVRCGRDKGMLYQFTDGTLRYVCFCGSNLGTDWIDKKYDFDKKSFRKQGGNNE